MKEFTRGDSKWKRWRIFRVSIDRYPERRSILERNDDVSSWEERVVSFSLSLSRCTNEPRVIYEIVFHPVTISFHRNEE